MYRRNSILKSCCKILAEKEKALSALSDIRISVSRQCFCAFRCFPGDSLSLQPLQEQVKEQAEQRQYNNSGHQAVGNHQIAVMQDESTDADLGSIISAATSSSREVPAARRRPAKIIGKALGRTTLFIVFHQLALKLTATLISSVSTFLTPL